MTDQVPSTEISGPPTKKLRQDEPSSASEDVLVQQNQSLRIGSRSSQLALKQVTLFTDLLQTIPELQALQTSVHATSTSLGDVDKTTSLQKLATAVERSSATPVPGTEPQQPDSNPVSQLESTDPSLLTSTKSLWTSELEAMLVRKEVDILIHSLKDVPTNLPAGCMVRGVGPREEKRDCVLLHEKYRQASHADDKVGLARLPHGARVGTSSVRRAAMIRRAFPHLEIVDIRGNVPTRIRKLDHPLEPSSSTGQSYDALVLAAAGLQRLSLSSRIDAFLSPSDGILHAVGQGALGVEWRADDARVTRIIDTLIRSHEGKKVHLETVVERALLRELEGGCSVPVGVDCTWVEAERSEAGGQGCDGNDDETKGTETEGNKERTEKPEKPEIDSHAGKETWTLHMQACVVSPSGTHCVDGSSSHTFTFTIASNEDEGQAEQLGKSLARDLIARGAGGILDAIRNGHS